MNSTIKHLVFLISSLIFLLLSSFVFAQPGESKDDQLATYQVTKIDVTVNNIYRGNELLWFQQWANDYHIKTQPQVIISLLPFSVGDTITALSLKDAERLLRAQKYIQDALVTILASGIVSVEVIDAWTLFPTIGFSRTGGQNHASIGVRDTNLLGLGIESTLSYKQNPQQTGYRLRLGLPIDRQQHIDVNLIYEDYDEGIIHQLEFIKPFYALDTSNMFRASTLFEDLETIYYQNDSTMGVVNAINEHDQLQYGWLDSLSNHLATRQLIGASHFFRETTDFTPGVYSDLIQPRQQDYVWWGQAFEYQQYVVMNNLHIMSHKEDINLGYQFSYKIGVGHASFNDSANQTVWISELNAQDGMKQGELLILQQAMWRREFYQRHTDYIKFNYQAELYYPITEKSTFYSGQNFGYLNQFRDDIQSIGGDNGMRGYPTQFQHGRKKWLTNIEWRYYPEIILWDSFALGFAGFVDIGRAYDNFEISPNIDPGALYSVGFGARIFPSVFSGNNVIHIDLARPISSSAGLSSWQWQVEVKTSF